MSLPLQAVDRLFDRLLATYGRDFTHLYEGVEIVAVKTLWAHELLGFAGQLRCIAWALEHLPERAPNVIVFRNLCRMAPTADAPKLPEPQADKERVLAELTKLEPIRRALSGPRPDGKDWARRIVAKHESGRRVNMLPLKMAREVLAPRGIEPQTGQHAG